MKQNLNEFSNIGYNPGPKIKIFIWYYISLIFFESAYFPVYGIKLLLLRAFGAKIGRGVVIKPKVKIKFPWHLSVGDYSWIGEQVWIDNQCAVSIGHNVCISQGVYIFCGNHNYKSTSFDLFVKPVRIESQSWIGAKAVICPGSLIEEGAVVSACLRITGRVKANEVLKMSNNFLIEAR